MLTALTILTAASRITWCADSCSCVWGCWMIFSTVFLKHPYDISLIDVVSLWIFKSTSVLVYPVLERLSRAPSAPLQLRHGRPTRPHKVLSAEERAPTPNSASGESRKEPSPVPDMAGDGKNMEIPIRYSNKLRINVLEHCSTCCRAAVHGRWMGRWVVLNALLR